jgi:hypothetical protein
VVWAPSTYVNLDTLKKYFKMQSNANTVDDENLFVSDWSTAVARNVDSFCGRQFGQVATAETRYYKAQWDRNECKSYIEIDDLQDITGFKIYDTDGTTQLTNYKLAPRNAGVKGWPYTQVILPEYRRYDDEVAVLGKWGWNAIPSSIITATYLHAKRIAARRSSPFGIAGSPQDGSEIRLLAQLDPDFKTTLAPYVRKWYAR